MKRNRVIVTSVLALSVVLLCWPERSHASNPTNGAIWGDIPHLHLSLSANGPSDAAGLTDPWSVEAAWASTFWGDSWFGNGQEVPGASFLFNYSYTSADWCDHTTTGSNAVQWGLVSPLGLLTPCNWAMADAMALTVKTDLLEVGRTVRYTANSADVIFNSNLQWTSAPRLAPEAPFNFRSVAMHEFGHVLGLNHEDNTLAVMNTHYHPNPRLHADDRLGLRSLYPGPGTQTDIGPSLWKKTDHSSSSPASLVSFPTAAVGNQTITLEYTQENFGTTDATFNVGFFLSSGTTVTTSGILLGRNLGASEFAGHSTTYSRSVTIPVNTTPGTYLLGVCLDDDNALAESNEFNNCMAYPQSIQVTAPADLVISALSNPPAAVNVGGSFSVTETTANIGPGRAFGAYFTGYSLRSVASPGSPPISLGRRGLLALNSGQISTVTPALFVPSNLAAGAYRLVACADERNDIVESVETNNCTTAANTIQVARLPDLMGLLVSDPPATRNLGESFDVTDTIRNGGVEAAASSTVRYRLSADTTINWGDVLMNGTRSVPLLGAGLNSTGTVTVTIGQSMVPGTYYLAACADDGNFVAESNETNNCAISAATIQVTAPNLQVTSVSNPQASVAVGTGFLMTATTTNSGNGQAAASATRYWLSTDISISRYDLLLSMAGHAVPLLAAGGTSTGTMTVRIPSTVATGTYYLGACSDDDLIVRESNEFDNCRAASTTVLVTNPNIISDLVIDAVDLSALSVTAGGSVSVTDTTRNIGTGPADVSTTRYRLATSSNIAASPDLLGSANVRSVPALAAGTKSKATVTVTIPSTVPRGNYFLGACADDSSVVSESSETNNCRATAVTVQ